MGFGLDHEAIHIPVHVHSPSSAVLVSSKYHTASLMTIVTFVVANVLWRWLWHHASVYRYYFWSEERRPHLWVMLNRLGACQRGRSVVHRADARNSRFLMRGPSRYCCGDGNFNSAAGYSAATTGFRCSCAAAQKKFA